MRQSPNKTSISRSLITFFVNQIAYDVYNILFIDIYSSRKTLDIEDSDERTTLRQFLIAITLFFQASNLLWK